MKAYTLLGFVRFGRDEILPPEYRGYRLLGLLPDWSVQTWVAILVVAAFAAFFEGTYRAKQESETPRERHGWGYFVIPAVICLVVVAAWTHGRVWGKYVVPDTRLTILLDPPYSDPGDLNSPTVTTATIRFSNKGDVTDHNAYMRLQLSPIIQRVEVDNPKRVNIIGGGQGMRLSPTADLELLVPDLLPHEDRTVLVFIAPSRRSDEWSVYLRSDRHPNGRSDKWPLVDGQIATHGVGFGRFGLTGGKEIFHVPLADPFAPESPPSCRICHVHRPQ
jgi:hypothetical protein